MHEKLLFVWFLFLNPAIFWGDFSSSQLTMRTHLERIEIRISSAIKRLLEQLRIVHERRCWSILFRKHDVVWPWQTKFKLGLSTSFEMLSSALNSYLQHSCLNFDCLHCNCCWVFCVLCRIVLINFECTLFPLYAFLQRPVSISILSDTISRRTYSTLIQ